MATNKHATIRYHALDRCFSNPGRKYYIDDLISACNDAIYEYSGIQNGVKRRQIFDDINFMESDQGWSIPLERIKDGRRVYYRYSDKTFSIGNKGINSAEAEQLKETLTILSRFKGMPQFEWIEEIQIRLENSFKLRSSTISAVSFEENPYLKGLNHFTKLFSSIQNEQVLNIEYKGFKQKSISIIIFHPWHLKQYNSRWFVFGFNSELNAVTNLALDRIISLKEAKIVFSRNEGINFDEYFDDVVGVTFNSTMPIEKVQINVSNEVWPYIESKPLHGSQKIISKHEKVVVIELKVQINHELISLLFSYLDSIEIVGPDSLRNRFQGISEKLNQIYS